jgi:hypothetical protein
MSVEAEHLLVAGPSGGGKSTYLRELHDRHDGPSVFLTTKSNERTAANNPPRRVRQSSCDYPRDIKQVREWAREVPGTVQIIVDESQNAPSFVDGSGPTKDGLHEDRSSGVKWVVATQNPMDLRTKENGYGPIQQCQLWVWCGPVKTWHEGFFSANGMSGMVEHLPTANYEYVVLEPTSSLSVDERVRYRGETKEQYG